MPEGGLIVETRGRIRLASFTSHHEGELIAAEERIRSGVTAALRELNRFEPYKLRAPYTMVLTLKEETTVYPGQFYPGVERTGDWELTYRSDDIMEVLLAFQKLEMGQIRIF